VLLPVVQCALANVATLLQLLDFCSVKHRCDEAQILPYALLDFAFVLRVILLDGYNYRAVKVVTSRTEFQTGNVVVSVGCVFCSDIKGSDAV
jgi:hypothetical protein